MSLSIFNKSMFTVTLVIGLSACYLNSEVTMLDQNDLDSVIEQEALDLAFWQNVYPYGDVRIIGSEIHLISTGNWFLLTKKEYSNFVFEAEVLMPDVKEYSNSGIIFRAQIGQHPSKGKFAFGYQAEVDPSDRKWSGGLYEQATERQWLHPLHKTRSAPDAAFIHNYSPIWDAHKSNAYKHLQWNKYRIEANDATIKIWVNGVLTTHVNDTKQARGFIGIQHHGSHQFAETSDRKNTIRFKNIIIKEID